MPKKQKESGNIKALITELTSPPEKLRLRGEPDLDLLNNL